jgi:hypothetical protein
MSAISIGVNIAVYPVTYVSNEILNSLIRIVDKRGLGLDYINQNKNTIADGLFTWLGTRHLEKVVLEIYDSDKNGVLERFDMCFEYSAVVPSTSDSIFETNLKKLEDFLGRLPNLPADANYRVVVVLGDGAPDVPGWSPTSLRSVDHLKNQKLGGFIRADYIGAAMEYWG